MTIRDIYKLLSSSLEDDKELAREYLKTNKELSRDFFTFLACIGEFPFKHDKDIISLTGKEINHWWHTGSVFEGHKDLLLEILTEIWNKN